MDLRQIKVGDDDFGILTRAREELAAACFDFLPTRTALDLLGWDETDIFAHS